MTGTRPPPDLHGELLRRNRPALERRPATGLRPALHGYDGSLLFAQKAQGAFLYDHEGREYIDAGLGAGVHLLGHGHPVVKEAVTSQLEALMHCILPTEDMFAVGEHLGRILPHFHSFAFCNSGTEATMRACRLARAATGRPRIAMFSGGWHGGNDMLLFEEDYAAGTAHPTPVCKSGGVPDLIRTEAVLLLPYNDPQAFELIERHRADLAMVIIEPCQGSNPRDDVAPFLRRLREETARHGILLCFDEIISGFRLGLGGCQELYRIEADLATYGKTLGGGYPCGVVAGTEAVMRTVEGGDGKTPVFLGGTFSGNHMVVHVARRLLEHLGARSAAIYPRLAELGACFRDSVNAHCRDKRLPAHAIGNQSLSRVIFTDRPVRSRKERDLLEIPAGRQNAFYLHLLLHGGVHVLSNRIFFLSTAHDRQIVDRMAVAVKASLDWIFDA